MPRGQHQQEQGTSPEHFSRSGGSHYAEERRKRSKSSTYRTIGIVVAAVLVAAVVGVFVFLGNIQQRLSGGLSQQLQEELTTVEIGQPFYMLLLGIDRGEGREEMAEYGTDPSAYRTDTIILARVDPPNRKVTLVSIHRDTAVNMGEHGLQKINAAYPLGGEAYTTQVVSEFAGVPISHYADVDFAGMCSIVDQLGGIEVTVPVDVIDPEYTGAQIYAGTQMINGMQALQLCRARHAYDSYGDGDLYRAANQRMIIAAILKKVLTQDPVSMVATINQLANHVNTDFALADLLSLANQFRGMNVEQDMMSGINPTEGEQINGVWYEICDMNAWKEMMQRVNAGQSPYASTTQDETQGVAGSIANLPAQDGSSPHAPVYTEDGLGSVLVYNASETPGIAGSAAETLNNMGYVAEADNAEDPILSSAVYYQPGCYDKAVAVVGLLNWSMEPQPLPESMSSNHEVVVYMGMDVG